MGKNTKNISVHLGKTDCLPQMLKSTQSFPSENIIIIIKPLIKQTCTFFNFWPTVDIYGTREIEVHFTILFASKITLSSCEWKVMGSSTYISDGFGNQKNRILCSK